MSEYNAAIVDVIAMIDRDLASIGIDINAKNLSPAKEARLVEQARTLTVMRARIDYMREGADIHFLPDDPISYRSHHHE